MPDPILGEQFEGYELRQTTRGMYGKRRFLYLWDEWETNAPVRGEPWINPYLPDLVCVERTCTPWGQSSDGSVPGKIATHMMVEATYSTDPLYSSEIRTSLSVGGEMMDLGPGRLWASSGELITDQSINVPMPTLEKSFEFPAGSIPEDVLLYLFNKVNGYWWQGYPPECARFDGVQGDSTYDYTTGLWTYRTVLKFSIKPQPWNWAYDQVTGYWDYTYPLLFEMEDFYYYLGF